MKKEQTVLVAPIVWLETADADPLGNIGTTLDGDGSVDMDLNDSEGSNGTSSKLMRFVSEDHDFISNVVIFVATAAVFRFVVAIGYGSTAISNELQIHDGWNVEQHVSMEDHGARREPKGLMNCGTHGTLNRGEGSIDDFVGSFDVVRDVGGLKGAKHVSHGQMRPFDNSVGLRVFDGDWYWSDSLAVETKLKSSMMKGSSGIEEAATGARVAR